MLHAREHQLCARALRLHSSFAYIQHNGSKGISRNHLWHLSSVSGKIVLQLGTTIYIHALLWNARFLLGQQGCLSIILCSI